MKTNDKKLVLVAGSIAIDTIETSKEKRQNIIGGSANYSAVASSLFAPTAITGVIGSDYPSDWLKEIKQQGITIDGIQKKEGKSFFWHGRYSEDFSKRTSIKTVLGVFEDFSPTLPQNLKEAKFVFLGNIKTSLQNKILEQLTEPEFVVMDTMTCWIEESKNELLELTKHVDLVLINNEEASMLTGYHSPFKSCRKLNEMGAKRVVIKLGDRGSLLYYEGEYFGVPPYPVENVVDPTGAGDCYGGAFIGALHAFGWKNFRDLKRASLYASAVASFAVENFGPHHILNLKKYQIRERYKFLRNLINW